MSTKVDRKWDLETKLGELNELVEGGSLLERKKALDAAGGDASQAAERLIEQGLAEPVAAPERDFFDELSEVEDDPEFQADFIYMKGKADIFVKTGPEIYRRQDYFKMPDEEWPDEWVSRVGEGMSQITAFEGYSAARPIRGLGMADIQRLFMTLHFEVIDFLHDPEAQMAGMVGEHVVDGRQVALYFETDSPPGLIPANEQYGFAPKHPIPVDGPWGERFYLSCLRCVCGEPFMFHRPGCIDEGPNENVIDVYELICGSRAHSLDLYLDLYHPGSTPPAPQGLCLSGPAGIGTNTCIDGFETMSFDDMVELLTEE